MLVTGSGQQRSKAELTAPRRLSARSARSSPSSRRSRTRPAETVAARERRITHELEALPGMAELVFG